METLTKTDISCFEPLELLTQHSEITETKFDLLWRWRWCPKCFTRSLQELNQYTLDGRDFFAWQCRNRLSDRLSAQRERPRCDHITEVPAKGGVTFTYLADEPQLQPWELLDIDAPSQARWLRWLFKNQEPALLGRLRPSEELVERLLGRR